MKKYYLPAFAAACLMAHPAAAQSLNLKSAEWSDGGKSSDYQVFDGFGCSGKNISPSFTWSLGPTGTKAYALTIYDPDAPTGSGWWHWIVTNIPAATTDLKLDAGAKGGKNLPAGAVMGKNDYGVEAYGGPCPPKGDKPHRYIVTLHALKETIPADAMLTAAMTGFNINANTLEKQSITVTYGR